MSTTFLNSASLPLSNNLAAHSDTNILEGKKVSLPLSIQPANVLGKEGAGNLAGDIPVLRAPTNSADAKEIISILQSTLLADISDAQSEFDISGFSSPSVLLLLKYWAMMSEQRTADAKLAGTMNNVSLRSLDSLMAAFHSQATTALFGGIATGVISGATAIAGAGTQLKGIKLQNDSAKLLANSQSTLKTAKDLHDLEVKKVELGTQHANKLNELSSLPADSGRESQKAALLQSHQSEIDALEKQMMPLRGKLDGQVYDTVDDLKKVVDDLAGIAEEQAGQQAKGLKMELSGKAAAQTGEGVSRVASGSAEYAAATARGQEVAASTMKDLSTSMREQVLEMLKKIKESIDEILRLIEANNRLMDETVSAIVSHTGRA